MSEFLRVVCAACKTAHKVRSDLPPTVRMRCVKCNAEMAMPEPARRPAAIGQSALAGTEDDSNVSLELSGQATVPQMAGSPVGEHGVVAAESVQAALAHCGPSDGRYVEQGVIGKGGMGEIVLCIERNTRRQVAMKRMLPTAAQHPQRRARFVEEAQVTAQLEHPNIVPVHELDRTPDGTIYFTMKLVKGRSLAEVIEGLRDGSRPFSLGELLTIFLKVCDGVAFAHSRGVVHRDLKPANIMAGDFGEVLVMDWGIAKIVGRSDTPASERVVSSGRDSGELHTVAGAAIGTPAYMSPEQAAGRHEEIDARSDIYSLGCILYELLTLQRAVEGLNARAMLDKVINEDVIPPEQRAPDRHIPRELSAVTMKCLAKARSHRYQSVTELSRDLKLYLEGRSVSAQPDTFAQAVVKLVKRNKAVSVSIAAAAILLLVVGAFSYVRIVLERDRAVTSERQAVTARQKQRADALTASEALARQAVRAAEESRFYEADVRADAAVTIMPDGPWGYYAQALVARERHDAPDARRLLAKALEIDPTHVPSQAAKGELAQAADLAGQLDEISDWRLLLDVGESFMNTRQFPDAVRAFDRALLLMSRDKTVKGEALQDAQERQWLARAEAQCIGFYDTIRNLSAEEQLKQIETKLTEIHGTAIKAKTSTKDGTICHVNLGSVPALRTLAPLRGLPLREVLVGESRVRDLRPLKGMSLTVLHLHMCSAVSDLGPLRGMPLTVLDLALTGVQDLTPLAGMPLKHLNCSNCWISDLSPLRGMSLEWLNVQCSGVLDLTPLEGMPLQCLNLFQTPVSDLRPLEGMPLARLQISSSRVRTLQHVKGLPLKYLDICKTAITDLTPLEKMELDFFIFTPGNIMKGIEVVRKMKSITSFGWRHMDHSVAPEVFWRRYDSGVFSPLPKQTRFLVPNSVPSPQTWRYTTQDSPRDWFKPDMDCSQWPQGLGGFGDVSKPPTPEQWQIRTRWQTTDIWLRREFTIPHLAPSRLRLVMNNDDEAEVYINGVLACVAEEHSEGAYVLYPISAAAIAAMKPGRNVLAVHCRNANGSQYVDVGIVELPELPASAPATQSATKPGGCTEDGK